VPETGVIAPGADRVASQYSTVMNGISDLHSSAVQISVTLKPPPIFSHFLATVDYSYNRQQTEYRGWGGTTAGDPRAIESVAGAQPVHQFLLSISAPRLWWFDAAIRLNVSSGIAYTPLVANDINGDGVSNDRAFIPDPSRGVDSALARQMATLLAAAPASARRCLEDQLGQIATGNSCRSPWQPRLDLALNLVPPPTSGLGRRLRVTTQFLNAGAAVMRLLGLNSALALGSGQVDSRLLYVTGFDPVARRFSYTVNQTFGQPMDFGIGPHRFPPFQLRLGVEYRLGIAPTNPMLRHYGLSPNDGKPTTPQQVERALQIVVKSPIDTIVALRDSLALDADQVERLAAINATYHASTDSLVAPVVAYVIQRGMNLTDSDLTSQMLRLSAMIGSSRTRARDQAIAVLAGSQQTKLQAILHSSERPLVP